MALTVVGWIVYVVLSILVMFITIAIGAFIWTCTDTTKPIAPIISGTIGIILCGLILSAFQWYYSSTESGKRAVKTQQSDLSGGINRRVEIYDVEGDLIREYEGRFDIDYDDDRIVFDDENGRRHIIYYPTGTVVVDEISTE